MCEALATPTEGALDDHPPTQPKHEPLPHHTPVLHPSSGCSSTRSIAIALAEPCGNACMSHMGADGSSLERVARNIASGADTSSQSDRKSAWRPKRRNSSPSVQETRTCPFGANSGSAEPAAQLLQVWRPANFLTAAIYTPELYSRARSSRRLQAVAFPASTPAETRTSRI